MVSGITTTTTIAAIRPDQKFPDLTSTEGRQAFAKTLQNDPATQALIQQSKQRAREEIASAIPDDKNVPSDITDLLRQLDELTNQVGHDNNPNEISIDPSNTSPVGPRFQDTLAQITAKVQAATAGQSGDAKGAILAYVSHALSIIDNGFQKNQDNFSLSLSQSAARGVAQQTLPNGKSIGANAVDEIQLQRDGIKSALNSLLGSQGLTDVVGKFSDAGYHALRASEGAPGADTAYHQDLDGLSGVLAGAKDRDSQFGQSFLTYLVKDFGQGLDNTFAEQQKQYAKGIASATDSDTVKTIKDLVTQLDAQRDSTSKTIAKLLQQLSGNSDASSSSAKRGLFFNVKA